MTGEKVALRAVELADVEVIHRWENDPEVWKVSNTITPFSRYLIEQYVLNSDQDIFAAKQLRLMIDRIDGPQVIPVGAIDLFEFEPMHRRAGVGILIDRGNRGAGLASEALQLIKSYAFETLQLHQLYCHIHEDNVESLKLFQKHGFIITGTRKEWLLYRGVFINEHLLQCINSI